MPIDPASFALVSGAIANIRENKINKALAGTKTYSRPKTIFGKLIGGVSGRTAASDAQAQNKTSPLTEKEMNAFAGSAQQNRSVPVTGGISFGGEAIKRSYLPFYLGAIVLGIFFFMRRKGGRRRR